MKKTARRWLCCGLLLALLVCMTACGEEKTQMEKTAEYLQAQITEPTCAPVGGEWLIFGLARSGIRTPQKYFDTYYGNLEAYVQESGGVLSARKYTEYSRVILALTAIGKDPANVAGYNLLLPLGDFEGTVNQGINGAIFALLALDSGGYEVPENPEAAVQATRQMYVDEILRAEAPEGGWGFSGGEADADLTAMALQALAKYRGQPEVKEAAERGVTALARMQAADGSFESWDEASSESVSQVIVALTELGIGLDDTRFVKGGQTLEDVLLRFARESGAFGHTISGGGDEMATEQALYALAAIARAEAGKTTLYNMSDVKK